MNKTLAAIAAAAALVALNACSATTEIATPSLSGSSSTPTSTPAGTRSPTVATPPASEGTAITITAAGQTFTAMINDSQVSRDFLATLPATMTWNGTRASSTSPSW